MAAEALELRSQSTRTAKRSPQRRAPSDALDLHHVGADAVDHRRAACTIRVFISRTASRIPTKSHARRSHGQSGAREPQAAPPPAAR